jgi:hypothetical protein
MPKFLDSVDELKENTQMIDMHQMTRSISKQGRSIPETGEFPIATIDAHVAEWLKKGYELLTTHYLGENTEAYLMLYILVKRA